MHTSGLCRECEPHGRRLSDGSATESDQQAALHLYSRPFVANLNDDELLSVSTCAHLEIMTGFFVTWIFYSADLKDFNIRTRSRSSRDFSCRHVALRPTGSGCSVCVTARVGLRMHVRPDEAEADLHLHLRSSYLRASGYLEPETSGVISVTDILCDPPVSSGNNNHSRGNVAWTVCFFSV